jgi:hypothetical protein
MSPPKVLPTVATKIAGQNISGNAAKYPNNTGSEPRGKIVAANRLTAKTAGKPTPGIDSQVKTSCMSASRANSSNNRSSKSPHGIMSHQYAVYSGTS